MKTLSKLLILLLISMTGVCNAPSLKGASQAYRIEYVREYLHQQHINNEIKDLEHSEFSPENLKRYLELKNVSDIDIVLRQAILESGWFKSGLFRKGNNIFGMRLPKVRSTLAIGKCYGHARYKHWTDSVKDFIMWQNYWKDQGKYHTDYYRFLNNIGYATASNYVNTLKRIDLNRLA